MSHPHLQFSVLHHVESAGDHEPDPAIYRDVIHQVQVADELGYDIAWVAEHHFAATRGRAPAPALLLVHFAARTRRIRVGSAVLPVPYYHPIQLAETIAMTDVLTEGRFACGLSSGGAADEMQVFGASQEGKHVRLHQSLIWLERALAGEPVTATDQVARAPVAGEAGVPQAKPGVPFSNPSVRIVPALVQPFRDLVWVAASTPDAARVAGQLGHHLLLPSLRPVPSSAGHVAVYREALAAAGHDYATRRVQNTFHLVLDADHDVAMRRAEPIIHAYYERYVTSGVVQRLADESLPSIMARINFVAGGPEAVASQLAPAVDALGLTHVAFQSRLLGLTNDEITRGLELVMSRVAPLLR